MKGIYKITSPSNKVYVGQSIRLEERIIGYKKQKNCNGQPKLFNSFLKYGIENHKIEIIEECSVDLLNIRERYWQDYYDVLEKGLNCLLTKTDVLPKVVSKETKKKLSKAKKGKKQNIEHINKRVISKKGYIHSFETKNKIALKKNKILLDLTTGIFYDSILIAAKTFNINTSTLQAMLSGRLKNKTNLIHI
jgi:group I intron endonuclease